MSVIGSIRATYIWTIEQNVRTLEQFQSKSRDIYSLGLDAAPFSKAHINKEKTMAMSSTAIPYVNEAAPSLRGTVVLLGRLFFALIFVMSGANHFSSQVIAFAASQGVPLASVAVPLSGVIALIGGLSILLGYHAKIGAWLIVLFLVPVTLALHKFWGISDPMIAQAQMIMFMKNVSMLGGALLISQFGAGPLSLDARRSR
jgi:putative oxidoreductase